mmetsp:Transcript_9258/g.22393  ORF Transcript_9258/g.22393 Transcript_9258/m.22393 type:complete len:221 (-) Transcript_9258:464-1126(-)
MWARGTGQGIGLSGHRTVYSAEQTLVDNWSEERFGRELDAKPKPGHVTGHETESQAYAAHDISAVGKAAAPFTGLRGDEIFRHGAADGPRHYLGTVSQFSFTDPRARTHGGKSADRVARVLWSGSKHNDLHVPVDVPEPKTDLLRAKQETWRGARSGGKPVLIGSMGTETGDLMATATNAASLIEMSRSQVPAGGNPPEHPVYFGRSTMLSASLKGSSLG